MSRSNPKLIGAFVIGALTLTIGAILPLGSGQLIKPLQRYVLFFRGSMSGLNAGTPVTFRGVKIGSVTKDLIQYDLSLQCMRIPVSIEIEPTSPQIYGGVRNPQKDLPALIAKGLRAQLETTSLLTGLVNVNFDLH
jgi:paraquat-inducible protein B